MFSHRGAYGALRNNKRAIKTQKLSFPILSKNLEPNLESFCLTSTAAYEVATVRRRGLTLTLTLSLYPNPNPWPKQQDLQGRR